MVNLFIPLANGGQSVSSILINQGKAERKAVRKKRKDVSSKKRGHVYSTYSILFLDCLIGALFTFKVSLSSVSVFVRGTQVLKKFVPAHLQRVLNIFSKRTGSN